MSKGNLTFQVESTVRVQESGHLVNPGKHSREELRKTIRACLRELGPERRQLEALVSQAVERHGETMMGPVRRLLPDGEVEGE